MYLMLSLPQPLAVLPQGGPERNVPARPGAGACGVGDLGARDPHYATPNVQHRKFRWISVGAVAAILTWIIASVPLVMCVANLCHTYDLDL
jgi:hypothetical protein